MSRPPVHSGSQSSAPASSHCSFTSHGVDFYLPSKFTNFKSLGKGSFGTVISAYDTTTHMTVAIKKISCIYSDTLSMKRILREINILKSLSHPNIISIIEVLQGNQEEERARYAERLAWRQQQVAREQAIAAVAAEEKARIEEAIAVEKELLDYERQHNRTNSSEPLPPLPSFRSQAAANTSVAPSAALPVLPLPPQPSAELDVIYVISEAFPHDLSSLIADGTHSFDDSQIQYIMYQLMSAVTYLHSLDIMHRDLKPSNILIDEHYHIKLCDFGLARVDQHVFHDSSAEPAETPLIYAMTEQVVSRWYRAPEIFICSGLYDISVDLWSCGTVLAELIGRQVLFPGKNPLHQLQLITEVIGRPSNEELDQFADPKDGSNPCKQYLQSLGSTQRGGLNRLFDNNFQMLYPFASKLALDLLSRLLKFCPQHRLKAYEAMQHPYFERYFDLADLPDRLKHEWRMNDAIVQAEKHYQAIVTQHASEKSTASIKRSISEHDSLGREKSSSIESNKEPNTIRERIPLARRRTIGPKDKDKEGNSLLESPPSGQLNSSPTRPHPLQPSPLSSRNASPMISPMSPPEPSKPVVLHYHRLSCSCGHCSYCLTRAQLMFRLKDLELEHARIEKVEREKYGTSAEKAAAASSTSTTQPVPIMPVGSSGESYLMLRAALMKQLDEFARPSTARLIADHQALSSPNSPAYTNVSEPSPNTTANSSAATTPAIGSISVTGTVDSSPVTSPRTASLSVTSSTGSTFSFSTAKPLTLGNIKGRNSTTLGPITNSRLSSNAPSADGSPAIHGLHPPTPTRRPMEASPLKLAASPKHIGLQRQNSHNRSVSLPVWTDMISNVANGIITSVVNEGGAPPAASTSRQPTLAKGVQLGSFDTDAFDHIDVIEDDSPITPATITEPPIVRSNSLLSPSHRPLATVADAPPINIANAVDDLLAALSSEQTTKDKEQQQQRRSSQLPSGRNSGNFTTQLAAIVSPDKPQVRPSPTVESTIPEQESNVKPIRPSHSKRGSLTQFTTPLLQIPSPTISTTPSITIPSDPNNSFISPPRTRQTHFIPTAGTTSLSPSPVASPSAGIVSFSSLLPPQPPSTGLTSPNNIGSPSIISPSNRSRRSSRVLTSPSIGLSSPSPSSAISASPSPPTTSTPIIAPRLDRLPPQPPSTGLTSPNNIGSTSIISPSNGDRLPSIDRPNHTNGNSHAIVDTTASTTPLTAPRHSRRATLPSASTSSSNSPRVLDVKDAPSETSTVTISAPISSRQRRATFRMDANSNEPSPSRPTHDSAHHPPSSQSTIIVTSPTNMASAITSVTLAVSSSSPPAVKSPPLQRSSTGHSHSKSLLSSPALVPHTDGSLPAPRGQPTPPYQPSHDGSTASGAVHPSPSPTHHSFQRRKSLQTMKSPSFTFGAPSTDDNSNTAAANPTSSTATSSSRRQTQPVPPKPQLVVPKSVNLQLHESINNEATTSMFGNLSRFNRR